MSQASQQWRGAITRPNRSRLNPQSVVRAARPQIKQWRGSDKSQSEPEPEGRLGSVITDTDYTQPSSEHWELPLIIQQHYPGWLQSVQSIFKIPTDDANIK